MVQLCHYFGDGCDRSLAAQTAHEHERSQGFSVMAQYRAIVMKRLEYLAVSGLSSYSNSVEVLDNYSSESAINVLYAWTIATLDIL